MWSCRCSCRRRVFPPRSGPRGVLSALPAAPAGWFRPRPRPLRPARPPQIQLWSPASPGCISALCSHPALPDSTPMASLLCCGPKLAACGIVLSAWGVIMLIMLGIFFNVHSAVLIEDVPFTEKDFENGPQNIYNLYEQVSYNCFIAAGLYLLLGGFSFCQVRLNKRKEYMVR
ncbi:ribonuclease kappa [Nannospalax galili]|uniref:ribonuclease kappa n=1 Tax=Nannospalax galili TaxID=1026970 RepID=UPI000819C7F9|nr:ribonuclease kappa [Nannospalax galili]